MNDDLPEVFEEWEIGEFFGVWGSFMLFLASHIDMQWTQIQIPSGKLNI